MIDTLDLFSQLQEIEIQERLSDLPKEKSLNEFELAKQRMSQCGQIHLAPNENETKESVALWFARQIANVINADKLTKKQVHDLISGTYSQLVIATSLNPGIDSDKFLAEVRRQVEDNRHIYARQQAAFLTLKRYQLVRCLQKICALRLGSESTQ